MKREVATEIVDSLKEVGVDFVATLTEANLHDLVMALGEDPAIHHVPVTREEEGIGIPGRRCARLRFCQRHHREDAVRIYRGIRARFKEQRSLLHPGEG